jgi:26S proteasome regulatory subunit N6
MVTATTKPAPSARLQQADDLKEVKKVEEAVSAYKTILSEDATTEQASREKEYALSQLGQLYRDLQ